jgi:peroxiredoxin
VLKVGDPAPDFGIGKHTLHQLLDERRVVVFFFPKTFTAG